MTKLSHVRPSQSLKSLETLRIIAAVAVVFAHSGNFVIPFLQPVLGGAVFVGSIGVDVFFIISGFVMGISSRRFGHGGGAAWEFLIARFFRLFPLYLICTSVWLLWLLATHKPINILHVVQSIVLLPTWDGQTYIDPLVSLGWTLRFEFYFYLLVGIGIAINKKIVVPFLGILLTFGAWLWSGYYYGAPLVLEFIAGFLLSAHSAKLISGVRARIGLPMLKAGLMATVVLVLLTSIGKDFGYMDHGIYSAVPRLWIVYGSTEIPRILAWGIPSFLLVYFCLILESDLKWRLSSFGKYTFSVYLLQFFVLPLASKVQKVGIFPDVMIFIFALSILALGSVLSFKYIEFPALKLRSYFKISKEQIADAPPVK